MSTDSSLKIYGFRRDYYLPDIEADLRAKRPVILLGTLEKNENASKHWNELREKILALHRQTHGPLFHRYYECRIVQQKPTRPSTMRVLKNTFHHLWLKGTLFKETARLVATLSLGIGLSGGTLGAIAWAFAGQIKQLKNGTHILNTDAHRVLVRIIARLAPLIAVPVALVAGALIVGGLSLCRKAFMSPHAGSFRATYLRIWETYEKPFLHIAQMSYESVDTAALNLDDLDNDERESRFIDPLSDEPIDPKDIQTPRVLKIGKYLVKTENVLEHFKKEPETFLWFTPEERYLNFEETEDLVINLANYYGKSRSEVREEILLPEEPNVDETEAAGEADEAEGSEGSGTVSEEEEVDNAASADDSNASGAATPEVDPLAEGLDMLNDDQEMQAP